MLNKEYIDNYCVRSQRLAGYLMQKGFKLHKIAPNKKYPNRNVFYFSDSDELHNAVEGYKTQNKN